MKTIYNRDNDMAHCIDPTEANALDKLYRGHMVATASMAIANEFAASIPRAFPGWQRSTCYAGPGTTLWTQFYRVDESGNRLTVYDLRLGSARFERG